VEAQLRIDNVLKIKSRSASMENGVSGGHPRHVCWSYNEDDTVGKTATGRRSSGAKPIKFVAKQPQYCMAKQPHEA
jgi:hypothetical protein